MLSYALTKITNKVIKLSIFVFVHFGLLDYTLHKNCKYYVWFYKYSVKFMNIVFNKIQIEKKGDTISLILKHKKN
jgi:hypothetical protein